MVEEEFQNNTAYENISFSELSSLDSHLFPAQMLGMQMYYRPVGIVV